MDERYFVFDVETPNRNNDRICSIGFVILENGNVKKRAEYLVNPEVPFDSFNTHMTGITPEMVKDAPTFPQVWTVLEPLLNKSILVAHNASFDLSVLGKVATAYDIDLKPARYLCTLKLARKTLPHLQRYRLNDLCNYYEIPLDHHQSGSDSDACARLLLCLIRDGCRMKRAARIWDFKSPESPKRNSITPALSAASKSLNELLALLTEVASDNILTAQEALAVAQWLEAHSELEGNYPFDRVFSALRNTLADGVLDSQELNDLLLIFQQLTDPVGQIKTCDSLEVNGKLICLTGEFDHGSKSEVTSMLESHGAIIKRTVVKKLDYLIVGGQGSDAWASGNYGAKIKRALELQGAGADIQIIRESDLFTALEGYDGRSTND